MATIYIPLFIPEYHSNKRYSTFCMNPGIGGTQFTALKLALFLAKYEKNWTVNVVNSYQLNIINSPNNLNQIICDTFEEFLSLPEVINGKYTVIVAYRQLLQKAKFKSLNIMRNRIIAWSRHPFDIKLKRIGLSFAAVVCVGTYQYYSMKKLYSSLWHIQNIFIEPDNKPALLDLPSIANDTLRLLYLGALSPGKGFLHIAKAWNTIKNTYQSAELHVIGSGSLYGEKSNYDIIPADKVFADKIFTYIPKQDIVDKKVIFYDNLGENKFEIMQKCHVALLNPTGKTEAFPASPLECMSLGIPVIAANDYGMSDTMRFFPELALEKPEDIPCYVEKLVNDENRYLELQQRAITVSSWYALQLPQIITRWKRLINMVLSYDRTIPNQPPFLSFHGSSLSLFKRTVRTHYSYYKNSLKALSRKYV